MSRSEILANICEFSQVLKKDISGIAANIIGEWSLETGSSPESSVPCGIETQDIDIPGSGRSDTEYHYTTVGPGRTHLATVAIRGAARGLLPLRGSAAIDGMVLLVLED